MGTIDYNTGAMSLIGFRPIALAGGTSQLRISVLPHSKNIKANENQILTTDLTDPNGLILLIKDVTETDEKVINYTNEILITPRIGIGTISSISDTSTSTDSTSTTSGGTIYGGGY